MERQHQQQLEDELTAQASRLHANDNTLQTRPRNESARQSRKRNRNPSTSNNTSHLGRVYGHVDEFLGSPLNSPGQTTIAGGASNAAMLGVSSPKIGSLVEHPAEPGLMAPFSN